MKVSMDIPFYQRILINEKPVLPRAMITNACGLKYERTYSFAQKDRIFMEGVHYYKFTGKDLEEVVHIIDNSMIFHLWGKHQGVLYTREGVQEILKELLPSQFKVFMEKFDRVYFNSVNPIIKNISIKTPQPPIYNQVISADQNNCQRLLINEIPVMSRLMLKMASGFLDDYIDAIFDNPEHVKLIKNEDYYLITQDVINSICDVMYFSTVFHLDNNPDIFLTRSGCKKVFRGPFSATLQKLDTLYFNLDNTKFSDISLNLGKKDINTKESSTPLVSGTGIDSKIMKLCKVLDEEKKQKLLLMAIDLID